MKVIQTIGDRELIIESDFTNDVYYIRMNDSSKLFYIQSLQGYCTMDIIEFNSIEKALKRVKELIKQDKIDNN